MVLRKKPFRMRMTTGPTLLLVLAGWAPAGQASEGPSWALGQVASDGVTVEGDRLPSGSTLTGDSLLETGDTPATLHLRGGQVLRLASHSSAYFEAAPQGAVRMDLRSGSATLRGAGDEARSVSEPTRALFSQDGRIAYQTASLAADANLRQAGSGVSAEALSISGAETECIPDVPYPVIDAVIRPESEVREAKVHFRAAQYAEFYTAAMRTRGDEFVAILPVPAPETRHVVYFVEAVSSASEISRTEQLTAEVVEGERCKDRGGVIFTSGDPGTLFSTVTGTPAFPPGFIAPSSGGVVLVGGGGLGPWAKGGIIAGSVIAGAVLIQELDEDGRPASRVLP